MLKKEDIATLEKAFGIKDGELAAAIADAAEKPLPIDVNTGFVIKPKADFDTLIANTQTLKYNEGKTAGEEIVKKEFRKEFGLEALDISKTAKVSDFKTVIIDKVSTDLKIEPNAKIQELTSDLGKMKTNWETAESKLAKLEGEVNQEKIGRTINFSVVNALPKELILPVEEAAELTLRRAAAAGIKAEVDENGQVIFKKGNDILKDNNLVPLKADSVLKPFYEPFAKPTGGGSGGTDDPAGPAKAGSLQAFTEEMAKKNPPITPGSAAYNTEMQTRIKAGTLKV